MEIPESIRSKLNEMQRLEQRLEELRCELTELVDALQAAIGKRPDLGEADGRCLPDKGTAHEPRPGSAASDVMRLDDAVVKAVCEAGRPVGANHVIAQLKMWGIGGFEDRTINSYLSRLALSGRIVRVGRGLYGPPSGGATAPQRTE